MASLVLMQNDNSGQEVVIIDTDTADGHGETVCDFEDDGYRIVAEVELTDDMTAWPTDRPLRSA